MSTNAPTESEGRKPNRLACETSPYLLQHRFNPVDWWAWGPAAFAEARRRDVPIFLSVGYSTCYWCHVMERECFESEPIAARMNADFVCVKVDREERPDVDDVYMAAVQAFTRRGGWPMSVFLEPATLRPFWAGTYFPAEPMFQGTPTFPHVLESISRAWREQRTEVVAQAEHLAEAVRERVAEHAPSARVGEAEVTRAVTELVRLHDPVHGGFGGAPKFPQPAFLDLLLAVRKAAGDEETRRAVDSALGTTLTRMALGGVFDQVGGGFHRYSVDDRWIVPHFEKMLYDNGALAETYARAYADLGSPLLARTARRICEYVLREMASPRGGFYSAQDAEVDHREGRNYLWTMDQLVEALGREDAEWIAGVYGLRAGPNFRDPHHPHDPPSNVLFVGAGIPGLGERFTPDDPSVARLDLLNTKLYERRALRDQPSTDTKILAGWNGLMIAGLAVAGSVLREPRFVAAARRAADFILGSMRDPDGGLFRTFGSGRASIPAFLEDYALLAHGLIELDRAVGHSPTGYVRAAEELLATAEVRFGDGKGGFFDVPADQPDLFVRTRSVHDGAIPGGGSVMIHNFIDLGAMPGGEVWRERASRAIASVSGVLAAHPLGAANSTRGLLRMLALDRGALEAALAEAPSVAPPPPGTQPPVEILSAVEMVEVAPDAPVGIVLRVRIAPGFHVSAADPGEGVVGLVPFQVRVAGGTGVAVYADYPKGEPYGGKHEIGVYTGEFDLPVVLERAGDWTGTPQITVTYQPCMDGACLEARTVELSISIVQA
jgi:hypothetical protein